MSQLGFKGFLCIFFSANEELSESFKQKIKQNFSFFAKIDGFKVSNESFLAFYGRISLADQETFQTFLRLVIDDFITDSLFKVFVILYNAPNSSSDSAFSALLDKFLFLYKNKLIQSSSYFNIYTDKYVEERYNFYVYLKEKVIEAITNFKEGIELYIQPIYVAPNGNKACTECSLYGYEVLSRLRDLETGELIYPRSFFEVLYREVDLSLAFQSKVLKKVMECVPKNFSYDLHVNFTGNFLQENYSFFLFLKDKKKDNIFSIEVVEYAEDLSSFFTMKEEIIKALSKLQKAGYQIFFDDVFEGLNNFNLCFDFPCDGVKLSKKILCEIKNLSDNETGHEKKKHVLSGFLSVLKELKKQFPISIFVEGIETVNDLLLAKHVIGADYYQGFYLGKPFSLRELFSNKGGL